VTEETPFAFVWLVDEDGYEIVLKRGDPESAEMLGKDTFEFVEPRGGATRQYRPLDDDGLWLRFAGSCKDAEGIRAFANEFGRLGWSSDVKAHRLDRILETAEVLREIGERLIAGDRRAAWKLFATTGLPTMKEVVLWYADKPERYHYRLIPLTLRDALLHQAAEAITGNRHFRRCRNEKCPNWFRLGPHAENGRRSTITARREFCSDRCRVASARRQKREGAAYA
jgi:hypothetical protein